jgi:hypothetical protein
MASDSQHAPVDIMDLQAKSLTLNPEHTFQCLYLWTVFRLTPSLQNDSIYGPRGRDQLSKRLLDWLEASSPFHRYPHRVRITNKSQRLSPSHHKAMALASYLYVQVQRDKSICVKRYGGLDLPAKIVLESWLDGGSIHDLNQLRRYFLELTFSSNEKS